MNFFVPSFALVISYLWESRNNFIRRNICKVLTCLCIVFNLVIPHSYNLLSYVCIFLCKEWFALSWVERNSIWIFYLPCPSISCLISLFQICLVYEKEKIECCQWGRSWRGRLALLPFARQSKLIKDKKQITHWFDSLTTTSH